ncbi:MAG: 6-bladed beta-propeller [Candidatus Aminicenantes bacterium]|nr:MAG: 6-bladed beta-propeller [Candidatus Aminicenantes bacterium]
MRGLWCMCLVLAMIACSSEKPTQVDTVMENGVEVVLNHIEPYRLKNSSVKLSVEREFSIDFEREDLAKKGVSEILGYDVDSSGNIFCLCNAAIFKFDPKGNFLFKFSRKGQGPGEFSNPGRCAVSDSDEFWLFDSGKYRFILFDQDGEFLKEDELKVQGDLWGYNQVYYLDDGKNIQMAAPLDFEEANPVYRLLVQDAKSGKIQAIPDQLEDENPMRSPRHNLLHEKLLYQVGQCNIYVYSQQNPQFEINIYDYSGTPQRRIHKQYEKIRIDEEFKAKRWEWFKKHPMSRVHKMQGYFPDFYPPIKDFHVDSQGGIFVETYDKGEDPDAVVVDIFNPDGAYISRTTLTKSLSKRFKHDRLYALHEKESGFQELIVSSLGWD